MRERGPTYQQRDRLLCECWCESSAVLVTPADIAEGLTGHCHRLRCKAWDTLARTEHQRRKSA